jgi:hypothetical protein
MKKALIIAHLFYASPRIPGLAKYLPEFGWEPIILTTPIGENSDSRFGPPDGFESICRVVETAGYSSSYGKRKLTSKKFKSIRPFLKFFYKYYKAIAQYPDSEKDWEPFAVMTGHNLFRSARANYPDTERGWKTLVLKTDEELLERGNVDGIVVNSSPRARCCLLVKKR